MYKYYLTLLDVHVCSFEMPLTHNAPTLRCDEVLLVALTTVTHSSIILIPRYRVSLLILRSTHYKSHEGIIVFGITNFLKLKTVRFVIWMS